MLPGLLAGGDSPRQGIGQALQRGRYMAAVARMEFTGVPVERDLLDELRASWDDLKGAIIAEINRDFPVFDGGVFKADRFAAYLAGDIRWRVWNRVGSTFPTTFRELARSYQSRSRRFARCA
jgi:hypothetical protein